jgi:Rrf2 family protein
MLTKTTESAIQTLIYLVLQHSEDPIAPRHIADELGLSPTYLAKVTNLLVRSGILRAHRGTLGGVTLGRAPREITLLQIVEACQGQVIGDYCQATDSLDGICAFHRAMLEMHQATLEILSRWTLADLAAQPGPGANSGQTWASSCRMGHIHALGETQ